MATLIDSSLWIDFTRPRSPRKLKHFIAPYILAPDVALAEPVVFEVLRYAGDEEAAHLLQQFQHLPVIPTPADLWRRATDLGQRCRKIGVAAGAMDLPISIVALHHGAELVTFDRDFEKLAEVCDLRVTLLQRPAP